MQENTLRPFARSNRLKTLLLASCMLAVALFFGDLALDIGKIMLGAGATAFFCAPLSRLMEKRMKRAPAAVLSFTVIAAAIAALIYITLPALIRQFSQLAAILPKAMEQLQNIINDCLHSLSQRLPQLSLSDWYGKGAALKADDLFRNTVTYAGSLFSLAYRALLSIMLGLFFLIDRDRVLLRLELLMPAAWRKNAIRMGNAALRELRLYLRGQITIAFAVGLLAAASLALTGLREALLLGLIVGAFNMIPYLGPYIGSVPAVLTALNAGWQRAVAVIIVLFLVQQIDGLVLSPRIMGSVSGFSPAVVLLALFIGSRVGGVWGMLFSLPVFMCIRTVYRVFVQSRERN